MEVARQVLGVLAVFILLGAALWILRSGGAASFRGLHFRSAPRRRQLESIERVALTTSHSLHLVRIGEKEVVVATHPQGCVLLVQDCDEHGSSK
jgi:flagellar biogenesis protein FliO